MGVAVDGITVVPRRRRVENWATVQISPLAEGWRALYFDGKEAWTTPAPVLLLRELRSTTTFVDEPGRCSRLVGEVVHEEPRETVLMPGVLSDGMIDDPSDDRAYWGLLAPGENAYDHLPVDVQWTGGEAR